MQIKQQPKGSERVLYTGVFPFQIVAINPSMDELKALGVNASEEPNYLGEKDGKSTVRIDFWLRNTEVNPTLLTKKAYFLENRDEIASTGSMKIVNNYLQHSWSKDIDTLKSNEKMKWFKHDGIRVAKVGEVNLLEVVHLWAGLTKGYQGSEADECVLSLSKLFSGDFKELKSLVKPALEAGNGIKYLLGVTEKDGKYYQAFYDKYIMRPSQKTYTKLTESLNEQYGEFKADFQNSFEQKVYTPGVITPDSQEALVAKVETDLPF